MRVVVKEETHCTYSHREPEDYGAWEQHFDYEITGVFIVDDDYKLSYGEEGYRIPDDSEDAYVIHMIYSDGDSFGRSTGNGVILGVFGTSEAANLAYDEIKKQVKNGSFTIEVLDDEGKTIKIHNPAAGYFEHADYIELNSYKIGKGFPRRDTL